MLQISALVQDESTGEPIAAQVFTSDANGNTIAIARSNSAGGFSAVLPEINNNVLVVAPGYAPKVVDVGEVSSNDQTIGLTPLPASDTQATTIIPGNPVTTIPWWVWVAGAGALVYFTGGSKKKAAVSGSYGWILPVGIVVAGYLILSKLGLFGQSGTGANNAAATSTITKGTTTTLAALAQQGINPTLTAAQAASIANTIFSAGMSVSSTDSSGVSTIFNLLGQARNDADIYLIMQNFGTRQAGANWYSACALVNMNCDAIDMDSFVTLILNQAAVPGLQLSDLNYQLANNELGPTGITYQF